MTQFYIQPRQTGKTTKMIIKAVAEDLVIVCATLETCKRTLEMMNKYMKNNHINKHVPEPITWGEFIQHKDYRNISMVIKGVIIEDLEYCLSTLSKYPIVAVTASAILNIDNKNKPCYPIPDGYDEEWCESRGCPL